MCIVYMSHHYRSGFRGIPQKNKNKIICLLFPSPRTTIVIVASGGKRALAVYSSLVLKEKLTTMQSTIPKQ